MLAASRRARHRVRPADQVARRIITAAKPPQPIPGGLPGPGLLAHVAVAKYVDHLPLHRQERQFARHGLDLSRQTTCDWALAGRGAAAAAVRSWRSGWCWLRTCCTPTPRSVKIRDAQRATAADRLLLAASGGRRASADRLRLHAEPHPRRSGEMLAAFPRVSAGRCPQRVRRDLARRTGDGRRIVEVGCWMHARRKFFEARAVDRLRGGDGVGPDRPVVRGGTGDAARATGRARGASLPRARSVARIVAVRQERRTAGAGRVLPLAGGASRPHCVPKNPVRQAMEYALRQQAALSAVLRRRPAGD